MFIILALLSEPHPHKPDETLRTHRWWHNDVDVNDVMPYVFEQVKLGVAVTLTLYALPDGTRTDFEINAFLDENLT